MGHTELLHGAGERQDDLARRDLVIDVLLVEIELALVELEGADAARIDYLDGDRLRGMQDPGDVVLDRRKILLGCISAFKFNQRKLDLDEEHVYYKVTPRQIILTLARAVQELGVTHPLHIHGCNLGIPGNIETTLDTVRAAEGLRIHMTHTQFLSYGTEGDKKFSSGAARLAELVAGAPNVSIDVGQVLFGQT